MNRPEIVEHIRAYGAKVVLPGKFHALKTQV